MSTGVGMSECCLSGKVHGGKPSGREKEIGGIDTYIAEPESGSKAKTVIFLVDGKICQLMAYFVIDKLTSP